MWVYGLGALPSVESYFCIWQTSAGLELAVLKTVKARGFTSILKLDSLLLFIQATGLTWHVLLNIPCSQVQESNFNAFIAAGGMSGPRSFGSPALLDSLSFEDLPSAK